MGDITLVEGLFEMCEKYFGKAATKIILGLVLLTVMIGCLGFILNNFIIPSYHTIGVMIQDRERIIISRRQLFDTTINGVIAGFLYLLLYWIVTFPARRNAAKNQKANDKLRQEIERTRANFADLERELLILAKHNSGLQSSCLVVIDSYIRALEIIRDGKNLPKLESDGDLAELYEVRERIREEFSYSKKLIPLENPSEPSFELMPPSLTPDKSASPP